MSFSRAYGDIYINNLGSFGQLSTKWDSNVVIGWLCHGFSFWDKFHALVDCYYLVKIINDIRVGNRNFSKKTKLACAKLVEGGGHHVHQVFPPNGKFA